MATASHPDSRRALAGGFVLCFLVAGVPFWRIPYSEVNVPDAFYGIGLLTVFASAALLRASGRACTRAEGSGRAVPVCQFP